MIMCPIRLSCRGRFGSGTASFLCIIYRLDHFGVIPIKNSQFILGIGRERTERYSSLKRLLIVPLTDTSAHLNEKLFSREMLLIKYGVRRPVSVMSLLDIVYRSL